MKKQISEAQKRALTRALAIAEKALQYDAGSALDSPAAVSQYLKIWGARLDNEAFGAIFLDTRHKVIACETLFNGSIDGASVYPRVVARRALLLNAAAIIIFHNHPSGITEPSNADIVLTQKLKDALALVEVRLLDHFIIGRDILSLRDSGHWHG